MNSFFFESIWNIVEICCVVLKVVSCRGLREFVMAGLSRARQQYQRDMDCVDKLKQELGADQINVGSEIWKSRMKKFNGTMIKMVGRMRVCSFTRKSLSMIGTAEAGWWEFIWMYAGFGIGNIDWHLDPRDFIQDQRDLKDNGELRFVVHLQQPMIPSEHGSISDIC
jgi:hypothetical protein